MQMAGASVWVRKGKVLPQGLLHELNRLRRPESRAAMESMYEPLPATVLSCTSMQHILRRASGARARTGHLRRSENQKVGGYAEVRPSEQGCGLSVGLLSHVSQTSAWKSRRPTWCGGSHTRWNSVKPSCPVCGPLNKT